MTGHKTWDEFLAAIGYSVTGIIIFALCFFVIVKISPFPVIKEIEHDQNVALSILIGAVFIGLSIIIASAIH